MNDDTRMWYGYRGIPKQVRTVIWLTSFAGLGLGYMFTYIAAYLPERGFSSGEVGLVIGVMSAATIFAAIPFGLYSDRVGRKRVLVFALAAFPPILAALALASDLASLLLISVAAGVSEGAFLTAWNALIADQTTLENRNAAFAMSFIVNNSTIGLGSALPFFFPFIEEAFHIGSATVHSWAFLLIAAACVITPLGIWMALVDYHEGKVTAEIRPSRLRAETRKRLVRFSLTNSLIGLGAGFSIALVPTWLWLKFDIPDSLSGPLLAIASITMAFASIASTRIAFRYGPVRAIVLTQGLSTIFLVLIPILPAASLASTAYVIRAMFMNMSSPIADSFLMSIIDKEERGLASAINNIVWRLPNSITTVFGGMLLAVGLYDLPFYITAVCYATAIALFYHLFRDVAPSS